MHKIWYFLLFALVLQVWPAESLAISKDFNPQGRTLFDDELRELMEFVRLQMKCGYPAAGIPPLAPYEADFKPFHMQNGPVDIQGNFTNLTVSGLDEYEIAALNYNNIFRRIKFDMLFEDITAVGGYKMNAIMGLLGPAFGFYGDGLLNLQLKDLRMHGSFRLQPTSKGRVEIFAFKVQVELGSVHSRFTGIMNSTVFTKLFNAWLEEFIQLTFDDSPEQVSAFVHDLFVPSINKALHNVTVIELIAVIIGLGGENAIPTEAFC